MTREEITETLQLILERYPEVQLAILYGSVARDTHRRDSDVDLAIAADSRATLREDILLDISLECSRATAKDVQVRDLARAQGLFLKQVLTTGRIILSRDAPIYGELIVRMLAFVTDMLPAIRKIRRQGEEYFDARP